MELDVNHVAKLAMLSLTDEEKSLFSKQLGAILSYIDKLNELDVTDVEPTSHVLPIKNVFREDVPTPSLRNEEALMNSPDKAKGFYRAPKIIE
jgi:aspartyl-tRNA(Asn)/glutamyl-tRNA(Gln) amidotransferase subunit C